MTKRFVMKNLFYFPKVSGFGRILVSSDTDRMALTYACPRGKSLLLLKNKRISEFPEFSLLAGYTTSAYNKLIYIMYFVFSKILPTVFLVW